MGEYNRHRNNFRIILICFLLSCFIIIITTPLHEVAHWIMSEVDPYIEPVEFHVFDSESLQNGENTLLSALGYVTIKEAYPGAFKDRPKWMNIFQELVCIIIQIIITCIIVTKILTKLENKSNFMI